MQRPQDDHDQQPPPGLERAQPNRPSPHGSRDFPIAPAIAQNHFPDQARQGIDAHHQPGVIGELGVAGQHLAAQGHRPADRIEQRHPRSARHLLANDPLDHRQQQGQPDHGGDDHGEHDADHVHRGELVDDARHQPTQAARPQRAGQEVHKDPRQPELEHRKPAVCTVERQDVEKRAKGVQRRVLAVGQKGRASPEEGVPQGQTVGQPSRLAERAQQKALPGIILQHQVGEQLVVRHAHT